MMLKPEPERHKRAFLQEFFAGPDLCQNCLQGLSADDTSSIVADRC